MSTAVLEAPGRDLADDRLFDEDFDLPKGYEFVDGELREKIVSNLSSYVAGRIFSRLEKHVEATGAGWLFPEGISFRCFTEDPKKIRRADTAFHRLDRLTEEQAESEGACTVVPDLIVEVISRHDTHYEVDEKRFEWLEAGVKLVWIVNPQKKILTAYRPNMPSVEFVEGSILTGEPVLPGFGVPLAELFRLPKAGRKES